jgi:hypothetical protein
MKPHVGCYIESVFNMSPTVNCTKINVQYANGPEFCIFHRDFMKKTFVQTGLFSKSTVLALTLAASLGAGRIASAADATDSISDDEIRAVLQHVAQHQIHPLADGDYSAVTSVDTAKAAKAPEGIAWSYPWGVTLFGMLRATDVIGAPDADKFVVEHNLICARYYDWLAGLQSSVTNTSDLAAFTRGTKIKPLISLGNLDSCGSMGNAILESMIRHPDQVTPGEKAVVGRIADWVVKKQERLPDGTLWRPKVMNGPLWPDDL